MPTGVLLPETLARQNGAGPAVALGSTGKTVLVTLGITRILERESLELSIAGSEDGMEWRTLAEFPPECYCGTYTMRLNLSAERDVRYLRAEWKVERWGANSAPPLFEFSVRAAAAAGA
jgi:hypothetical protein